MSGAAAPLRRLSLVLLFLGCLLLATASAQFRVTVEEVVVDVLVTRDGRPVTGLQAGNFSLFDAGERRVVRLVPTRDRPLAVLFVMDLSRSLRPEQRTRLAAAAQRFARGLAPGDRCAVGTLAARLTLPHPFAACRELPGRPFPDRGREGGTALWDALLMSAALAERAAGRSLVILFTDGLDNGSWTPEAFVSRALMRTAVVLYAITPRPEIGRPDGLSPFFYGPGMAGSAIGRRQIRPGRLPDDLARALSLRSQRMVVRESAGLISGADLLGEVAVASGGRMLIAEDEDRLDEAYARIFDEVRSRYLLAFRPDPAGWRELRVEVAGRGHEVRARTGYWHRGPDP